MTLKENYQNILFIIKELLKKNNEFLSEDSIKSLNILLFKIEEEENKDKMLSIITREFNLFGENEETPLELLKAKKLKLDNIFKKNLNFL